MPVLRHAGMGNFEEIFFLLGPQHTNYRLESFKLRHQYFYSLSPRQAEQMMWSTFVEFKEDIFLCTFIKSISTGCYQENRQDSGIIQAFGTISQVLHQFDKDDNVAAASGAHSRPSQEKEVVKIVTELLKECILTEISRCKIDLFPQKNLLHAQHFSNISRMLLST